MKSLYIIGSLALMGCAANSSSAPQKNIGTNYNIYIQSTFQADELADIDTGIQMWREAVPSLTLNETVSDTCPVAEHTICLADNESTTNGVPGYTIRDAAKDSATSTIYPSLYQWNHPELQFIIAHEVGHAMGLIHTEEYLGCANDDCPLGLGTLMYALYQPNIPTTITQTDIDQFWSLR